MSNANDLNAYDVELDLIIESKGGDAAFMAEYNERKAAGNISDEDERLVSHLSWHNRADDEWLRIESNFRKNRK